MHSLPCLLRLPYREAKFEPTCVICIADFALLDSNGQGYAGIPLLYAYIHTSLVYLKGSWPVGQVEPSQIGQSLLPN